MALTFVMTEQGIPCIYYGTEQGFAGDNAALGIPGIRFFQVGGFVQHADR